MANWKYLPLVVLLWCAPSFAQNNITLFGDGPPALGYTSRTKRASARLNSYNFFLKLPNKGVAELQIVYPEGFGGIFAEDSVALFERRSGKPIKIREIITDREFRSVRLIFEEPIGGTGVRELELRSVGVNNPRSSGIYQVTVQALGTEANPLFQSLGRWLVDIN